MESAAMVEVGKRGGGDSEVKGVVIESLRVSLKPLCALILGQFQPNTPPFSGCEFIGLKKSLLNIYNRNPRWVPRQHEKKTLSANLR